MPFLLLGGRSPLGREAAPLARCSPPTTEYAKMDEVVVCHAGCTMPNVLSMRGWMRWECVMLDVLCLVAIKGCAHFNQRKGKHIITSRIEHKAVLDTYRQLERGGFEVTYLDPDSSGLIHPEMVAGAIREDTTVVSIMHVNNELGTANDIAAIGKVCRENKVFFHVDAAQSAGKTGIDVEAMFVDMTSFSAHKIYIVRLLGVCIDPRKMCILMELMEQGSLRQYVDANPNLPTSRLFVIFKEIASGMAFAQAHTPNPILHRDLRPCNILVDCHGRTAIADFGLSTGAGTLSKTKTTGGTLAYDAPEVLDEDTWSTAGGVYSYAVLVWEVITTKSPCAGSGTKQIMKSVVMKEQRPHGKQWDEPMDEDQCHPFFAVLIKGCWAQEPGDRPSFADLSSRFDEAAALPTFHPTDPVEAEHPAQLQQGEP
jgi:serine/threonine protein kinase